MSMHLSLRNRRNTSSADRPGFLELDAELSGHKKIADRGWSGKRLPPTVNSPLLFTTHNDGPFVVIEAVGLPSTFRAAVDEVSFGGRVVYIGYAREPVSYETKYFVMKELDIFGYRDATLQNSSDVIQILESGRYPVADTITRTVAFAKAGEAIAAWAIDPSLVTKLPIKLE